MAHTLVVDQKWLWQVTSWTLGYADRYSASIEDVATIDCNLDIQEMGRTTSHYDYIAGSGATSVKITSPVRITIHMKIKS
jgi:hypothetical protein